MIKKDKPRPGGITKVLVSGFKSFHSEAAIDIRPLTLLAGANSSGKSTIMQGLLLLKQTLEKLPQTIAASRTRIRADAAFYDKDFVQYLDDNQLKYVIVAKNTAPIQKILPGIRFREFQENWSCGEFRYLPSFWKLCAKLIMK